MGQRIAALAALVAGATVSGTADATVVICATASCAPTDERVLVNVGENQPVITGTTSRSNFGVIFIAGERLNGNLDGREEIAAADGLLNSLTFSLGGAATFQTATFSLLPLAGNQPNEAVQIYLNYIGGSQLMTISPSERNFFGIEGTSGERFTSITFLANPITTGVRDLRQLRLGGVSAVPEPASWATMILGIGLVGASHRRRRKTSQAQAVG